MPNLKPYLHSFFIMLQVEQQVSPHTLMAYRTDLDQFMAFIQDRAITPETIRAYSGVLKDRGYAYATLHRKLSAIRSFNAFLFREHAIKYHPRHLVVLPKKQHKLPKFLKESEMERVMVADSANSYPFRNQAIVELLYATGLRVSECVGLTMDCLDPDYRFLRITGKGGKQRQVPIGQPAQLALAAYLANERPGLIKGSTQVIFLNNRGTAVSRQAIFGWIRQRGKLAGVHQRLHPHMMRHSFATHLLEGNANLRDVQEWLGHTNITTTQIYAQVSKDKLKALYNQAHPRSGL